MTERVIFFWCCDSNRCESKAPFKALHLGTGIARQKPPSPDRQAKCHSDQPKDQCNSNIFVVLQWHDFSSRRRDYSSNRSDLQTARHLRHPCELILLNSSVVSTRTFAEESWQKYHSFVQKSLKVSLNFLGLLFAGP